MQIFWVEFSLPLSVVVCLCLVDWPNKKKINKLTWGKLKTKCKIVCLKKCLYFFLQNSGLPNSFQCGSVSSANHRWQFLWFHGGYYFIFFIRIQNDIFFIVVSGRTRWATGLWRVFGPKHACGQSRSIEKYFGFSTRWCDGQNYTKKNQNLGAYWTQGKCVSIRFLRDLNSLTIKKIIQNSI